MVAISPEISSDGEQSVLGELHRATRKIQALETTVYNLENTSHLAWQAAHSNAAQMVSRDRARFQSDLEKLRSELKAARTSIGELRRELARSKSLIAGLRRSFFVFRMSSRKRLVRSLLPPPVR